MQYQIDEIIEQLYNKTIELADISSTEYRSLHRNEEIFITDNYFSSLANGDAGLALLCGVLNDVYPKNGWDNAAHRFLIRSIKSTEKWGASLFSGLAGLGFAANYLSKGGGRYVRLLDSIEEKLFPSVKHLSNLAINSKGGCQFSVYDIISGLSGITLFLVCRPKNTLVNEMQQMTCNALTSLILDTPTNPKWRQPAHLLKPQGSIYNLNLGLAHGLPGILVALIKLKSAGASTPRLKEALEQVGQHIIELSSIDECGRYWASWKTIENYSDSVDKAGYRNAWCYGTPGVCSALWLAGEHLGHQDWQSIALDSMMSMQARIEIQGWHEGPTFCHGTAGVLHIVKSFVNRSSNILPLHDFLLNHLISQYDKNSIFGYQDTGPNEIKIDRVGLLQGMAGIFLVLLTFNHLSFDSDWDKIFGLR